MASVGAPPIQVLKFWGFVIWSKSEQSPFPPNSHRTNAVYQCRFLLPGAIGWFSVGESKKVPSGKIVD
jgi:hypothetical protein